MMIAAATLAGENLFREWPTLANRDCLFYEIWITFSDYLEEKIKVCDQPLPIRLICPRLMAGNSSLYKCTGVTLETDGCQIPTPSV